MKFNIALLLMFTQLKIHLLHYFNCKIELHLIFNFEYFVIDIYFNNIKIERFKIN